VLVIAGGVEGGHALLVIGGKRFIVVLPETRFAGVKVGVNLQEVQFAGSVLWQSGEAHRGALVPDVHQILAKWGDVEWR
jgi:hypothetical protein